MNLKEGDRVKPSDEAVNAGMNPDLKGHIVEILPNASIEGNDLVEVLWPASRVRHRPEMLTLIPKSLFG